MEDFPLHFAVSEGDLWKVVGLIDWGFAVDSLDDKQRMPIHWAAAGNHLDIARLLLHKNCQLNYKDAYGKTPLLTAAFHMNKDFVILLLESGADVTLKNTNTNWNILHWAAWYDWEDVAKKVIEMDQLDIHSKTTSTNTAIYLAVEKKHPSIIKVLIDSGANLDICKGNKLLNILHYAASENWPGVLQAAIDRNIDIEQKTESGLTALLVAADKKYEDIVELLLDAGADVEVCDPSCWNILHYASKNGWVELVQHIIELNVLNIDASSSSGRTALHIAAEKGCKEVAEVLIQSGADVRLYDKTDQSTALHFAVKEGHGSICQLILNKDISTSNMTDKRMRTPLKLACESRNIRIIEILCLCGVNVNAKNERNETMFHTLLDEILNRKYPFTDEIQSYLNLLDVLIKYGAYFDFTMSRKICDIPLLNKHIRGNVEISTSAIINKFNSDWLPEIYLKFQSTVRLPCLDSLKIHNKQNVASEILIFVENEIASKKVCDIMGMRPPVLKIMCAKILLSFLSAKRPCESSDPGDSQNKKLCTSE